jgi:UDP-N-acetyl-D-galactosamine dehydrogenase
MKFDSKNIRIGVVGLGYVGLPLAVEFGKFYPTVGFDINEARVAELARGCDLTLEVTEEELEEARYATYTTDLEALHDCNVYVVTVPTPIGDGKRPLLTPLRRASETLSRVLKKGDIVIYESTVYPGATEEFCVPFLEEGSGLTFNEDFFVGYSPERINPGDKEHRLPTILKVTSGSTPEIAEYVDELYKTIITAGTHKASSIKVAEAAKVIENTQRDVNIALVNELAMIFERLDIDTEEVLIAAGTKWNFLPFRPGLVGGHCIGIDPYYLTYKAEQVGYHNMIAADISPKSARVLVLGLTFKENCPDLRNTRVVDIVSELATYGTTVDVHDPWVSSEEAEAEYGIDLVRDPEAGAYDAILIAVGHRQFAELGADGIRRFGKPSSLVYDIKYVLPQGAADDRL